MSILDNIKPTSLRSGDSLRAMSGASSSDLFNPQPYRYALLLGSDNTFDIDIRWKYALEMLFSSYGNFCIARQNDDPESFEQWKLATYKRHNIVIMFNFFGNPLRQARMIRSLCIIVQQAMKRDYDIIPLYRFFLKADPTHRGISEVWWPPKNFDGNVIKQIASRTATSDIKVRAIQDVVMGYLYLNEFYHKEHYYERVKQRLDKLRPYQMQSWFFDGQ